MGTMSTNATQKAVCLFAMLSAFLILSLFDVFSTPSPQLANTLRKASTSSDAAHSTKQNSLPYIMSKSGSQTANEIHMRPRTEVASCDLDRLQKDAACGCYYAWITGAHVGDTKDICIKEFGDQIPRLRQSCDVYMKGGVIEDDQFYMGLKLITDACVGRLRDEDWALREEIRQLQRRRK